MKFVLNHFDLDINQLSSKSNNQSYSLADLLILTKDNTCVKYICKYKSNLIKNEVLKEILKGSEM